MVTLPGFKQKRKEKIMDSMQEKVLKAWVIRVKVAASPVGAPRDWNPALVLLTSVGNLLTYSLPDLRPIYEQEEVILPSDQKWVIKFNTVKGNFWSTLTLANRLSVGIGGI